jgi:hypothetical protein
MYILVNALVMQGLLAYFVFSTFPNVRSFKVRGANFFTVYVVALLFSILLLPIVLLILLVTFIHGLFKKKEKVVPPSNPVDDLLKGFDQGGEL